MNDGDGMPMPLHQKARVDEPRIQGLKLGLAKLIGFDDLRRGKRGAFGLSHVNERWRQGRYKK